MNASPTIDEVRKLDRPSNGFMCEVGANTNALQFLGHSIADGHSGEQYFMFK